MPARRRRTNKTPTFTLPDLDEDQVAADIRVFSQRTPPDEPPHWSFAETPEFFRPESVDVAGPLKTRPGRTRGRSRTAPRKRSALKIGAHRKPNYPVAGDLGARSSSL